MVLSESSSPCPAPLEIPPQVAEALADLKGSQTHLDDDVAILVDYLRDQGGARVLHDFFRAHLL